MCFAIFDHHKFTDFNLKRDVAAYLADGVGMDVLCRAKRPEIERVASDHRSSATSRGWR